jgi:uncharacterized protein (TIGR02246 family)
MEIKLKMSNVKRLELSMDLPLEPIKEFIRRWQEAIDTGNAELFNQQFAADVLWGSPFGAIAEGYEQIHAIHSRMFSSVIPVPGAAQYNIEHIRFPSDNVVIVYVRRVAVNRESEVNNYSPGSFDELALLVLVQRENDWWLAAAQHVPDRRDIYLAKD